MFCPLGQLDLIIQISRNYLLFERANLGLAYVQEEIFPRLTVKENLLTGFSESKKNNLNDSQMRVFISCFKRNAE